MLHLPPSWCSDLDQISSIFWVPTAFHQLTWAQETEFKKQISPYVGMQNSTPRMTNDITYHPKIAFSAHFLAFSLAFFPSPMLRHLFWSQRKLDTNSTPKPKLVVVSTHLKNMLVKLDHFPKIQGEDKKYLKPPTRKKWLAPFDSRFFPLLPFQETPRAIPMAKTCAEAKVKVGSWTEPRPLRGWTGCRCLMISKVCIPIKHLYFWPITSNNFHFFRQRSNF